MFERNSCRLSSGLRHRGARGIDRTFDRPGMRAQAEIAAKSASELNLAAMAAVGCVVTLHCPYIRSEKEARISLLRILSTEHLPVDYTRFRLALPVRDAGDEGKPKCRDTSTVGKRGVKGRHSQSKGRPKGAGSGFEVTGIGNDCMTFRTGAIRIRAQ